MPATQNVTTEVTDIRRYSAINMRNARIPPRIKMMDILREDAGVSKKERLGNEAIFSRPRHAVKILVAMTGERYKLVLSGLFMPISSFSKRT